MTRPLTEAEAWREIAPEVLRGYDITDAIYAIASPTDRLRTLMTVRLLQHVVIAGFFGGSLSPEVKSLLCLFLACEAEGEG